MRDNVCANRADLEQKTDLNKPLQGAFLSFFSGGGGLVPGMCERKFCETRAGQRETSVSPHRKVSPGPARGALAASAGDVPLSFLRAIRGAVASVGETGGPSSRAFLAW